ncbi:MAG: hypothetical protein Q9168_003946 [Polycauliona sp. 1 TL-2023]
MSSVSSSISNKAFDYIIIGGGTAGLVLANRLTADPHVSVLVIEAGKDRLSDPKITTPGLLTLTYDDPQYDWSFDTVPQDHLYGKCVSHSRGKVLGGSSAINALALIYPPRSSIDAWERLGNEGWNWEAMAPYYRKFHTFNKPSKETADALATGYIDEQVQGATGPIQVSFPEFHGPLGKAWPETFKTLEFSLKSDPLSGQSSGGYTYLSTVDPANCERSHAGSAYYAPIATRPNLHVLTDTIVEKILLEQSDMDGVVAKGVNIRHNGASHSCIAQREVILCAGVIQSPQLLELSGIGSSEILESHGIQVVVDNPHVGENLQDHPMTGMSFEVVDGLPTIDMIRDPQVIQGAQEAYQTSRQGPLTAGFHSIASLPVVEFLSEQGQAELASLIKKHLPTTAPTTTEPSIPTQYRILQSILESPSESSIIIGMGASQMHFDKALQKDIYAITEPENYISFLVSLAQPFSRGSVHISSPSIHDPPLIDPRYLSHPLDLEILARHTLYIPTIANTQPLASLLKAPPGGRILPDGIDLKSLDAAKEHCKRHIITNNHPCGTCAMMPLSAGGVVDPRLRVHGVKGLRVVDASVFPMIPRGNIQSSVYAVAERGADMIMEDWLAGK